MRNINSCTYSGGFVAGRNAVLFISKPDVMAHDDFSYGRLYTWVNGEWGHGHFPFTIASSLLSRNKAGAPPYFIYSLGLTSGAVEVSWPKGVKKEYEFLPGASENRGIPHLQQIKEIGGRLYVVGPKSQIFRRKAEISGRMSSFKGAEGKDFQGRLDQWELFNQGVEPRSIKELQAEGMSQGEAMSAFLSYCSLNSIDGGDEKSLYACGDEGVIIFREKDKWRFLPKVTNADLRQVKQVDSSTIYVAGDRGTLLKGSALEGFSVIPTEIGAQLRGLEWFNGKLYIGSIGRGLFVFDGASVSRVPNLPDFVCHTLHAKDGQLLAIGEKEAFLTDDALQWRSLKNPDNL